MSESKKKKTWEKTRAANMVRKSKTGVYYARLRVSGRESVKSLGTKKYSIAKAKLPLMLNEMRAAAEGAVAMKSGGFETLRGCLDDWLVTEKSRPDLKESSQEYNQRRYNSLMEMLPVDDVIAKVGAAELRMWWKDAATRFNPTYANNLLSVVRLAVDKQVDAGLRRENVTRSFKKMPIPKTEKDLPTVEQMVRVIENVREQNSRSAEESADFISWIAFTGMRPTETLNMQWKDVGNNFVVVRHEESVKKKGKAKSYKKGSTKNYKERKVPIMDELRELINRRRSVGKLWSIKTPRIALANACKRLGLPHMSPYDLRHYFATKCLESGVDAATVGKWLGHSDGGALVMDTYGHVSDAHGLKVSKQVKLG